MNTTSTDLASLARDFESPDWNSTKALAALYANKNDRSAVQAICHAMENLTDTDLLSTLMQLCHLIVIFDFPELENLLMERCQNSMHFALRMFFLLQAAMEDEIPELVFKTNRMWKQCELAAINAETTSPPRNRVCVENGAFKRRSKLDGASMTLSPPRMQRSSSFTTTLPSIPLYGDHDIVDSLSASTSLIPNQTISSPSQQYKQTDNIDPIELNPDVSIWNQQHNGDTSSRPVDNNVAVTTNGSPAGQELLDLSAVSLTDSSNINGTSSTDTLRTSTQLTTDNSNDTTNTSLSSLSPPSSPRIRESDSTVPDQIASANPSYASAAPPSPATVATASQQEQIDHAADKAFGSSFSFRLRQLSGEGKSGKQRVYEYFYTELHMINSLFNISTALMSISLDNIPKLKEVRGRALHLLLAQINTQLIQSEYNPASLASTSSSSSSSSSANSIVSALEAALFGSEGLTYGVEIPVVSGWVIVKIHPEDSFCLSSRNRIPYMMLIEVLAFETGAEDLLIPNQPQHENYTYHHDDELINSSAAEEDWVLLNDDDDTPKHSTLKQGFIELWQEKEKRIKDSSPFSSLPGWRLAGVIVKSGDDLRQEQLASQLIFKMHQWFQSEKLPLFLRPYVVLATSSTTGLIECIPDTCSIDSLKKRIPNFGTLSNYYICSYGHRGSQKFRIAQTNFVESLAAYSIVCYLLQIKDRHNGNILLDVEGHMIHIDFGFMLSISPGNIGFELAPFKLNQEMVDLIGGPQSDMFKYFKTLLLSGFLEVRRHAEEMIMLVEVMSHHSKMACFNKGGGQVIPGLKERLALDKNEEQCLGLIDTLVSNAMKSWTTQSYDSYQYYTNGIL